MTTADANRKRLTALVAACTKLVTASRLVKEATVDVASSGLFPVALRESLLKVASKIDVLVGRVTLVVEKIPWKPLAPEERQLAEVSARLIVKAEETARALDESAGDSPDLGAHIEANIGAEQLLALYCRVMREVAEVFVKYESYVVRVWDGMDGCWTDCTGEVDRAEALRVWAARTDGGARAVSYDEIDHYRIFPGGTRMHWDGSEGRAMYR